MLWSARDGAWGQAQETSPLYASKVCILVSLGQNGKIGLSQKWLVCHQGFPFFSF